MSGAQAPGSVSGSAGAAAVPPPNDTETRERWGEEKTAAWLYESLARAEGDATKSKLFRDLAIEAEKQAELIADDFSGATPAFAPPVRARVVAGLTRTLGPRAIKPVLAAMKVRGLAVYAGGGLDLGHPFPTQVSDIGERHRGTGGGTLRAAVFGVNDGLVSNTCLVMGVAGATGNSELILLSGVAGLLAGAFSMASGEYISMRSQREMFEYQIAQEKDELDRYPEEEAEELALIYHARGVPLEDARTMSLKLVKDPVKALDTLAREELGLNPDDLGSPWGAAFFSFVAFAIGAVVPLIPFVLGWTGSVVAIAAALSGAALFLVGAALSLFSGRKSLYGGARMLLIGAAAAAATYAIGGLFNIAIS